MAPKLDKQTEDQIVGLYETDVPTREIAATVGRSIGATYAVLKRRGIQPNRQHNDPNQAAIDMYLNGAELDAIATETGVSPTSLYHHLQIANITPNRQQRHRRS